MIRGSANPRRVMPMTESTENKRRHFRIDYPKPDRPLLIFDNYKLEVIDLAEKGVKFLCGNRFVPKVGQPILGKIKFKDGKECGVAGTVLRFDINRDICVASLTQGIPYPKMMEEQLAIIRKYNKVEGKS